MNPKREKEAELMRRISKGDAHAFSEFYDRYHLLIQSAITKVLFDQQDAEDVKNEVLLTMWNKADSYHPSKGSLVTWICTTARNRAVDRIRSIQRRRALYDRYQVKMELDGKDSDESSFDNLKRADTRKFLRSALVDLTPEQKEVIELAYFKGLTQRQIAEEIESPIGTVKGRIRRGVERMQDWIENHREDEARDLLEQYS